MIGTFKCLNESCGFKFEHSWYPGDVNNPRSHAGTDCPNCGYVYVKKLSVINDLINDKEEKNED